MYGVSQGELTAGDVLAINLYMTEIMSPISTVVFVCSVGLYADHDESYQVYSSALTSIEQFLSIWDLKQTVTDKSVDFQFFCLPAKLALKNVDLEATVYLLNLRM